MERALKVDHPEDRAAALERIADDLGKHIASEEQVFYPAVRARRTEDILLQSLEEHLSLKRLLADLLELEPTAETWQPKLKVLDEQTRHHQKEEEEHLFPNEKKILPEDELGQRLARKCWPARPPWWGGRRARRRRGTDRRGGAAEVIPQPCAPS